MRGIVAGRCEKGPAGTHDLRNMARRIYEDGGGPGLGPVAIHHDGGVLRTSFSGDPRKGRGVLN